MNDRFIAYFLISLFTTAHRAEPIVGDLVELAETRGQKWFWLQIAQTVGALFWLRLSTGPLTVIAVVGLGLGLNSVIEVQYWRFVVEPYQLFPQELPGWLLYYAMLATSSAVIGIVLVLATPRRGLCACFLVGGILLCGALAHQLERFGNGQISEVSLVRAIAWVTFVGLFLVTSPLVVGGVLGRRLHSQEQ